MMYSFYMSQLAGTTTVMLPALQRLMNVPVCLALALLRAIGIWGIFKYTNEAIEVVTAGKGLFSSDLEVLICYSVYMWLGGAIFSQSFSLATSAFVSSGDKTS